MRTRWIMIGLAGSLVTACAAAPDYIPEERAVATLGGRTAARYPLGGPEGDEQGALRVASFGISKVKSSQGDSRVAHVRIALANQGDDPIVLDTRSQRVQLPDGKQVAPAWVSAAAAGLPIVNVPPASSRTLDLFFPLPAEAARDAPPRFDVIWSVDVDGETITRVTPFDEVAIDPAIARQIAAERRAYGPYTWYDPIWGPGQIGWPSW